MSFKKQRESTIEKTLLPDEQQAKIDEVKKMIGPIVDKLPTLCSEAEISRYLRARNWNTKKAGKMLKDSIKWRLEYKPEKIRWENVAHEAETGKIYKASYSDKYGRTVLIMRPGFQNTNAVNEQILYLVYCMENAINSNPDHEQMVWLINFQLWNTSSISLKVTRETAKVLQNHYPERLGLGILYNPPKIFESFWTMVKPFFEPKTFKKVKFVYSDNPQSLKTMAELFDIDKLDAAFGGRNACGFDYEAYAQRMKEDDKKMCDFIETGCSPSLQPSIMSELQQSNSVASDPGSEGSDEAAGLSSGDEAPAASSNIIDDKMQQDQPRQNTNDVANGDTKKQK
ncbi:uncharacterized protein LOC133722321 isoform X1 [Rosa rugosa]|uniref:uncharacterized protein LOC133722321 isoform X1 n=2 Tax=Rosa rugosa TaxID=74645 RepID=UPI002B406523|nr:uncharacterized protein LOC133722321 isoform X1 [Rosa rugosa]XP_062005186.1 uncharacterized protein LOC133722321 isoform X1 [Rosa rugosa]